MSKIAARDNAAMNTLLKGEFARTGQKTAAADDVQAFNDHEEYEKLMESVLNEDTKESWDPNDPILD